MSGSSSSPSVGADRTVPGAGLVAALIAPRATLAALALVAFALRAYRLAAQNLWSDEDITLDRAALPLRELLASLPIEHGPLYFVLMRGWTQLAGDSDFVLRFPSLAFGVLAVILAAHVGSRLTDRRTGLILALILAVNPFQVWYGQEARMYTLVGALILAALAAVLRAESTGRPGLWVAAGAAAALTVYAHYHGALLVPVLAGWALVAALEHGRNVLRGWLLATATAGLLFAPWLPRAVKVLQFPGWREPEPLTRVPWINLSAWSAGTTVTSAQARPIAWLYILLATLGLVVLTVRASGRGRRSVRWMPTNRAGALRALLYVCVPLAVAAAMLLRTTDFHPRYFFAIIPAYYLTVATGAVALPRPVRWVAVGLLAAAAVPALANQYARPEFQKQDYRGFLRAVESAAGHEDTVLFLDGPAYGLSRRYEMEDSPVKIVNLQSSKNRERSAEQLEARMAELAVEYPHLWLARDGAAAGTARSWLDGHAFLVQSRSFQDITLDRYLYSPPGAARLTRATTLRVTDDVRMPLAVQVPGEVAAGEVLPVALTWAPGDPIAREYKVSVRLVPATGGSPVVAVDRRPGDRARPTTSWAAGELIADRHGLLVPEDTEPGTYELVVVLYDAETLSPAATWSGPEVTVGAAP